MFERIKKIHFIGIGGSGMCGIAEVLINMGYDVSGSDMEESENVSRLKSIGAKINIGHAKENLEDPHVVVVSSAIGEDNPEVINAHKNRIPVIPRAEMLAELMRLKYSICIAGTHGKTTTTSMTGLILSQAGLDPTIVVGGKLKNLESNVKLGDGEYLVAEADESDGSFLHYTPTITVVTNIDDDHLEHYGSMTNLKKTFVEFLDNVPFYGFSVLCGDDKNISDIIPELKKPYKTYGFDKTNNFYPDNIVLSSERSEYDLIHDGDNLGRITVKSTGSHNVINSIAASIVALEMGIDIKTVVKGLAQYRGVGRRLEKREEVDGVIIYDDYAHHPTEIRTSLSSLRKIYPDKRIIAVFQPHRFSRTRDLYDRFPESLSIADKIYLTEVYPAGENPIKGVTTDLIYRSFENNEKVSYIKNRDKLIETLNSELKKDDVLITLGAGNIYDIIKKIEP